MKKLRKIDLYLIPLFFVTIAASILRTIALLTSFDTVSGHFDNKITIAIASGIVLLSVIGFASYLFLGEKERKLIARSDNAASYIPAGIVSIALIFIGAHSISVAFDFHPSGIISPLAIVCALLAFLSAGSFLVSVFIEKNEHLYKAIFSLSIVFFLAIYSVMLFFNNEVRPTNSPNKIVDQMAFLSAAIFFLFESRICIGRAKWRGYVGFGLIACLLTAYSSIPSLIVYVANGNIVSDSLVESILSLTISVFIFSKVLQSRTLTPAEECDAVKSISVLAARREEEIQEQRKLSRTHAYNNIVENDDTEDAANYTFDLPEAEPETNFTPEGADQDLPHND